ncbi:MAG: hypothetical protein AAGF95_12320 [Chloroflexota bacterium]
MKRWGIITCIVLVVWAVSSFAQAQGEQSVYLPLIIRGGEAQSTPTATPEPPLPTATPEPPLPTATPEPPPPTATPEPTVEPNCHPSYPTVCIPPPPPDLNCSDIPYNDFTVLPPDPHNFDGNNDGIGCES